MAAAHDRQHLPPSPPPSPPVRRRHKKKPSDPFMELGATPLSSPSPPASSKEEDPHESQEWLITRILLTPLLFTSFILSLYITNLQNRLRRRSAHPTKSSFLSYLYPSAWIDPEPYQDPSDTTWSRRGSAASIAPHSAISPKDTASLSPERKKNKSWHLHKKIRKVARMEVSDAFEMRGRVIVAMVCVMALCGVGMWLGVSWMVGMFWR